MNRFEVKEASAGQSTAGRPVASLIASVEEMAIEIVGREMLATVVKSHPNPRMWLRSGPRLPVEMLLGSRLWMEILLVAGVALCWSQFGRLSKDLAARILELVTALLLASLCTIGAANLHFGTTCCARHELLRECWIVMSISGVVVASSAWTSEETLGRRAVFKSFAPVLLAAAVLSLGHLGPLSNTYKMYSVLRKAGEKNFESGFRRDAEEMTFSVLPSEGIISEEQLAPGTYTASPSNTGDFSSSHYPYYILAFFEKQKLIVHPLSSGSASDRPLAGLASAPYCELILNRQQNIGDVADCKP
jgi:hypothetical protein